MKPVDRRQKVQAAEFGLTVLKALGELGGQASLKLLAGHLNESPAKIHRYLASLKEAAFVMQDPASSQYLLGVEAIAIGLAAMQRVNVLGVAGEELAALTEIHNVTSVIVVLGNRGPTIIRREEPVQTLTISVRLGAVLPILWSATGRVFGAYVKSRLITALIDAELESATRAQRKLLADHEAVEALFAEVRAMGCATIRNTMLKGGTAVAAPIFDATQKVVASLSVVGTPDEIDAEPGSAVAREVVARAANISTALGFRVVATASAAG